MELFGNTALITGGASGIGLGLAYALVERDNKVIICGRDERRLADAQRKIPGLAAKHCDLSIRSEREDLVRWTLEHVSLSKSSACTVAAEQVSPGSDEKWVSFRNQWEHSHVLRAVFSAVGLISLIVAVALRG